MNMRYTKETLINRLNIIYIHNSKYDYSLVILIQLKIK
jgi:hypothetical protein